MLFASCFRLESFDFHKECRALKWHRLSILMDRIEADILAMGYVYLLDDYDCKLQKNQANNANQWKCLLVDGVVV